MKIFRSTRMLVLLCNVKCVHDTSFSKALCTLQDVQ